MPNRRNNDEPVQTRGKPASTSEGRDNKLISLAMDLAERQMREGTASAQVISHYLKMGSPRERLELERLRNENELLVEKVEQLSSAKRMEELYEQAIDAMRAYSGQKPVHGGDYDDPELF